MRIFGRHNLMVSSALFLLALPTCGGKTKSQMVEVDVYPEKPIVITADTEDAVGQKVKGPYFRFMVRMTNGSDEPVTVLALSLEATGQDESGTQVTKGGGFDPATFNRTLTIADTEVKCTYSSFGTWAPGESKFFILDISPNDCDAYPEFLVGDMPKGPGRGNFRYRVKIKPVGFFGDESGRFERFVTFYTQ